jgi:lambda family phage portal protein
MANKNVKSKLGLIDRAICAISPEAGYRRILHRQLIARELVGAGTRGYDIGRRGRLTEGWMTSNMSGTSEVGSVLSLARNRARDLVRNNPYAANAVRKLQTKIVGTGIVPRLEDIEKSERKRIMGDWDAFTDNCDPEGQLDYYGLQSQAIRTIVESGEVLVVYDPRPSSWGLRIPLQMRVLEPDYLDHTKNVILQSGNEVILGVEYDKYGRRVAYWMYDRHPGDTLVTVRNVLQSRRISAEYVDHIYDPLRAGQARGMTWLAPVALKSRDLADYEEAELIRKKIEACHVGFVTRQSGAASRTQEGLSEDESGRHAEEMSPGMFIYGAPGEDVKFNNPTGTSGVADYMVQQLHAIAAGIGEPYFMMTGDVSRANYSSLRASMTDFWDLLDRWQHLMMIPMLCRKSWRRFASYRLASNGEVVDPSAKLLWTPPLRPYIDPLKDAMAEKAQIRIGRKTWRQSVAETGYDPDDIMKEHQSTFAMFDALGLTFDCDPRRVQDSGKMQDISNKSEDEQNA